MDPLVSVIIPTYNRANKIFNTLDSIVSQSYPSIEILVVDDGSTDDTGERLQAYIHEKSLEGKLFYYRQENQGAPSARNYGLTLATGELVVFFDSDDQMLPERIQKQVQSIIDKDSDCCSCGFIYSSGKVQHIPKFNQDFIRSYLNWDLVGSTSCWMYKKSKLIEIGGYDLSYACYQDWDLTFRYLTKCNSIALVEEILNIIDDGSQGDRITSQVQYLNRVPSIQRFYLTVLKWSVKDLKNRNLIDEVLFSYVHQITLFYYKNIGLGKATNSFFSLNQVLRETSLRTSIWFRSVFIKHLVKTGLKNMMTKSSE